MKNYIIPVIAITITFVVITMCYCVSQRAEPIYDTIRSLDEDEAIRYLQSLSIDSSSVQTASLRKVIVDKSFELRVRSEAAICLGRQGASAVGEIAWLSLQPDTQTRYFGLTALITLVTYDQRNCALIPNEVFAVDSTDEDTKRLLLLIEERCESTHTDNDGR